MAIVNQIPLKEAESAIYDNGLVLEVKKFQIAEGIMPDGIVGPQTLLHINTAVDSSIPTLSGIREIN